MPNKFGLLGLFFIAEREPIVHEFLSEASFLHKTKHRKHDLSKIYNCQRYHDRRSSKNNHDNHKYTYQFSIAYTECLECTKISTKSLGECRLNLVRVKLFTGRTHQIRVQFATRGCPLYGDGKYGAKDNAKIHLHSTYISFLHPKTGAKMEFNSNPEWL